MVVFLAGFPNHQEFCVCVCVFQLPKYRLQKGCLSIDGNEFSGGLVALRSMSVTCHQLTENQCFLGFNLGEDESGTRFKELGGYGYKKNQP